MSCTNRRTENMTLGVLMTNAARTAPANRENPVYPSRDLPCANDRVSSRRRNSSALRKPFRRHANLTRRKRCFYHKSRVRQKIPKSSTSIHSMYYTRFEFFIRRKYRSIHTICTRDRTHRESLKSLVISHMRLRLCI